MVPLYHNFYILFLYGIVAGILYLFFGNENGWFYIQFCNYILKCSSSKQNVVLLLSSMKLSCLYQEYLLVLGNLLVRKQHKNFLLYQTCMLVYILPGLATFLVLPQLSHDWHHIFLYQWVLLWLLHCPLHQSLPHLFFYVLPTFPSSFDHSLSCPSGYIFWFPLALENATCEKYWILESFPFQEMNLKH